MRERRATRTRLFSLSHSRFRPRPVVACRRAFGIPLAPIKAGGLANINTAERVRGIWRARRAYTARCVVLASMFLSAGVGHAHGMPLEQLAGELTPLPPRARGIDARSGGWRSSHDAGAGSPGFLTSLTFFDVALLFGRINYDTQAPPYNTRFARGCFSWGCSLYIGRMLICHRSPTRGRGNKINLVQLQRTVPLRNLHD